MSDEDRDRAPVRERRRTTIIETGERSGGGGAIALILLLIVVAGLAWFLMRSGATRTAAGVNVTVKSDGPAANSSH
jgi:lipopolysaccharide export system protein LptC